MKRWIGHKIWRFGQALTRFGFRLMGTTLRLSDKTISYKVKFDGRYDLVVNTRRGSGRFVDVTEDRADTP